MGGSALSGLSMPQYAGGPPGGDHHQMTGYDLMNHSGQSSFSTGFQHSPFHSQNFAGSMHHFHQGKQIFKIKGSDSIGSETSTQDSKTSTQGSLT